MAKLIFTDPNFSGKVYELMLEKTTVGRGDHNTLVIRDSSLSSTHCEILVYGSEVIVRDLDSSNGTFVDGVRLNKQSQVKSGQTVRFGTVEARLDLGPSKDETDTAEITAVYALGKIMRDQRQAKKQSQPDTASMELEPEAHPGAGEHTILIPRPPQPAPAPVAPPAVETSPEPGSKRLIVVVGTLIGVALIIVLWLVLRKSH